MELRRNVGARECLSVEFSVRPDLNTPTNEWWGTICLWIDHICVGNPNEVEMVSVGLGSLAHTAQHTGSRVSSALSSRSATEALESVVQAIYGEEGLEWLSAEEASKFEVLSSAAGPSFDNWEAILLEQGQFERFIYRREGHPVCEARWKLGTFKEISLGAWAELKSLAPLLPDTIQ